MPTGACGSCVTAQCCPQATACAGDPRCLALEACLLACGSDYECRAACVQANPVGDHVDVPALDTCVAASCRGPCGMPCGQAGSYASPPEAGPACQACIQGSNACAPALACATSLDCETVGHCAYSCTTPDCRAACSIEGGADNALILATFTAGALCYEPCRIGHDWTCVHHVVWPDYDAGALTATLTITDTNNNAAVPGASATGCKAGDDPCTSPVATGVTDDAGVVALPGLPSALVFGFGGHFELAAPSYVPELFYLAFPLSQPDAQLGLGLFRQTDLTAALAGVNIAPVAGRGHVLAVAEDCLLIPASNVVVTADGLDSQARRIYYAQSSPSLTATSTDPSGWAFFYNVAPGPLTLHAIPNDTGVESSLATVHVRADALSVVWLLPTALP